MLPDRLRLRRGTDFTHVMRTGVKAPRRSIVMYASHGEPRFGVVVGKKVGGAVLRNRVKRRLRHMAASLIDESRPMTVVVRALPPAGEPGNHLREDFASAWASCEKALT